MPTLETLAGAKRVIAYNGCSTFRVDSIGSAVAWVTDAAGVSSAVFRGQMNEQMTVFGFGRQAFTNI